MRLCPEARIIRGDMEMYSKVSHLVTEVIQEKVFVLEKASIDEFYLDLSGMGHPVQKLVLLQRQSKKVKKDASLL
ncbi:hypothetical protein ASG01_14295 [Chryseobacterium sp. Leaf180]|nr:hypothetical protein ASG01_14295 [Chryseobacterium sp. Leaf180]